MSKLLNGKVALITGASRGLGLAIARKYLEAGASVGICARDAEELAAAGRDLASVAALAGSSGLLTCQADVAQADQAAALVAEVVRHFGRLDILVNNAGIQGPTGGSGEVDWSQWLRTIEINLFGSVLMCRAALPHLRAAGHGKIIQVSGGGATKPMPGISAYAASKAAIVRFIETLAEEERQNGLDINAVAPGAMNTRMLDEILAAGPERVGADYYRRAVEQRDQGGTPPEKAADLAVFLGSEQSNGITGKLISAVWDPWATLPQYQAELKGSDIYTLRRIIPADRGFDWG